MNAVSVGRSRIGFSQPRLRRKRGVVPTGGRAPLTASERKLHEQLRRDGSLKSGRAGAFVYYVYAGKQRWRRFVVPKDPRTEAQARSRTVFGAVSSAWSKNGLLTREQRAAWYADGAKKQSRRRCGSSGKLTGQQDFIGRNCELRQFERGVLWDPAGRTEPKQCQVARKPELIAKGLEPQPFTKASSEIRRGSRGVGRELRKVSKSWGGNRGGGVLIRERAHCRSRNWPLL